jgi:hypothetical protein
VLVESIPRPILDVLIRFMICKASTRWWLSIDVEKPSTMITFSSPKVFVRCQHILEDKLDRTQITE